MKCYKVILYVYPHLKAMRTNHVIMDSITTNDLNTAKEIACEYEKLFDKNTDIVTAIYEIEKKEERIYCYNTHKNI